MKKILILYATFTGNTEIAAKSLKKYLPEKFPAFTFDLATIWDIKPEQLTGYYTILFGSSTWEDALNPDTEHFLGNVTKMNINLSPVPFALFALGDSRYEVFCAAVPTIHKALEDRGAKIYKEIFKIDGYPETKILNELGQWAEKFLKQEPI